MEKKIYTTPALSVEEYEMTIITQASTYGVKKMNSNADLDLGGGGDGKGNSASRAGSRGIWDED